MAVRSRSSSTTRDMPWFLAYRPARRACALRRACPRTLLHPHDPARTIARASRTVRARLDRTGGRALVRDGNQTTDRDRPGARAWRDPARRVASALRRGREALARLATEARLGRKTCRTAPCRRRARPPANDPLRDGLRRRSVDSRQARSARSPTDGAAVQPSVVRVAIAVFHGVPAVFRRADVHCGASLEPREHLAGLWRVAHDGDVPLHLRRAIARRRGSGRL